MMQLPLWDAEVLRLKLKGDDIVEAEDVDTDCDLHVRRLLTPLVVVGLRPIFATRLRSLVVGVKYLSTKLKIDAGCELSKLTRDDRLCPC